MTKEKYKNHRNQHQTQADMAWTLAKENKKLLEECPSISLVEDLSKEDILKILQLYVTESYVRRTKEESDAQ